jgi:hypothetical protein
MQDWHALASCLRTVATLPDTEADELLDRAQRGGASDMQAHVIYLQQARLHRARAAEARRLLRSIDDTEIAAKFAEYAANAECLEVLCKSLRQTVLRNRTLSAELRELCAARGAEFRDRAD